MTAEESISAFRARARAWLSAVDVPPVPLDLDERFVVLQRWQQILHAAGWMGIHWPPQFGGLGLTPLHHLAFYEELARVEAPPPIGLIGLDVVGPTIVHYGTDEQCERLVPPLLSGGEIWCQGFSEPGAGSDLAALTTRARIEGDEFVISGQKVWTSWAAQAHWCAVLARTDAEVAKHRGISYILVPMDTQGIKVRPLVQMTGDAEFGEVFFDDVRVPTANLLGELHEGWSIAMHTLGSERGTYALRRRIEHESAFRSLLSSLRTTGEAQLSPRAYEDIGAAYIGLRTVEAQTAQTLVRLRDGVGPSPLDSMDKLLLTEVEQGMYAAADNLLGPGRMASGASVFGINADRWVHGFLNSRAASIYGGTAQIQRNIVAERHLGLPKEGSR